MVASYSGNHSPVFDDLLIDFQMRSTKMKLHVGSRLFILYLNKDRHADNSTMCK